MRKLTRQATLVVLLALAGGSAQALDLPGPLVQTDWLADNLNDRDLVVLDVRTDPQNFAAPADPKVPTAGHIPGARLWDFKLVRQNRVIDGVALDKMVPTKEKFEAMMRDLGVSNDSAVVIVTSAADTSALTTGTRAYWTFKYFLHDAVALLDGGNSKWTAEQRPLSHTAEAFLKSDFSARGEHPYLAATTADVEGAVHDERVQLVDGRTGDFYLGQAITADVRAKGHIPRSKLLSHTDLVDDKTKTFKSVDDLKALAKTYRVNTDKPVITYCNTGHLGSGAWFVLSELLGNKDAKLYDGSMHEWTKDPARPVTSKWEM